MNHPYFLAGCLYAGLALVLPSITAKAAEPDAAAEPVKTAEKTAADPESADAWTSLFDGKTLQGWKVTDFPGHAEPRVEKGELILHFGSDMTGVTCTREQLPRDNYELELIAKRVDGNDFFCGLTFPIKDSPCTLVCGGWGGGVTGLSSIDGQNASENATTTYQNFERGQWYTIRLRVAGGQIDAWIDDKQVVDLSIGKQRLSIRWECEPCQPLGIATWCTTGAIKSMRIRELGEDEVKKIVAETQEDSDK
jgi:hypothetical protein